ncbi:MAG TPA: polyprenyl synthetase family protein [Balneolales bacterium]|nr:polyprenyl synthetase family protein [Balneolales bacterium]
MLDNKKLFTELIEERLRNVDIPDQPKTLYDPIFYTLSLGGKRIRPNLLLLSCGMCGGDPNEALSASVAIELLHNFTLIHDDIMDKADTRRGEISVYKKWNSPIAILSGDAMFAHAIKQLNYYGHSNKFGKDQFIKLYELFVDAVITVCEGQALDLQFESEIDVSIDEYVTMITSKTAALISCSMQMGAIIAGTSEENVQLAGKIGSEAGLAFQIQDDLLDAIGDPEIFGKKTGGDIYEGKKTYLSILALKKADSKQKAYLIEHLQNKNKDVIVVKEIIQLYRKLGVIDETKQTIDYHYQKSLQYLHNFGHSDYRDDIAKLLNLLTKRDR